MRSLKVIHLADLHLGKSLKGPFGLNLTSDRMKAHERAWEFVLDKVREEKPDIIVISGDLMDSANPSTEAEELGMRFLTSLGELATTVLIPGNHDSFKRFKLFRPLLERFNVVMVTWEEPFSPDSYIISLDRVGLVAIPFTSPSRLRSLTVLSDENWSTERALKEYAEAMRRLSEFLTRELASRLERYDHTIALMHVYLTNASLGGSERLIVDWGMYPDDLPRVDYVALGHIHKPQRIDTTRAKAAAYSGAPWGLDFGDGISVRYSGGSLRVTGADQDEARWRGRGFIVATFQGSTPSLKFVEVPSKRFINVILRKRELDDFLRDLPNISLDDGYPLTEAWLKLKLGEGDISVQTMERIIKEFPNIVRIEAQSLSQTSKRGTEEMEFPGRSEVALKYNSPLEMYKLYYKSEHGEEAPRELLEILENLLQEIHFKA